VPRFPLVGSPHLLRPQGIQLEHTVCSLSSCTIFPSLLLCPQKKKDSQGLDALAAPLALREAGTEQYQGISLQNLLKCVLMGELMEEYSAGNLSQ
jgi:hypothetical protein